MTQSLDYPPPVPDQNETRRLVQLAKTYGVEVEQGDGTFKAQRSDGTPLLDVSVPLHQLEEFVATIVVTESDVDVARAILTRAEIGRRNHVKENGHWVPDTSGITESELSNYRRYVQRMVDRDDYERVDPES